MGIASGKRWLKAELHSHCSLDPVDYRVCSYRPEQLITEAARLGYEVLAITCHDLDIWNSSLSDYAESQGILLVPGMEVTTEGRKHTLVYNFRTVAENLDTLAKIRSRCREDTLVIAPHPFFPNGTCLWDLLDRNIDLFDAVEQSGFYTSRLDFNKRARRLACRHQKPLVGNGDVHLLWQLGRTFTWIYSEPSVASVVGAIKRGLVRVESSPLSGWEAARWWATVGYRWLFPVNSEPSPTLDPEMA